MKHRLNSSGIVLLFYALCAGFCTFPLVFNMNSSIYGPFFLTDMRGTVWFSWWYKYAFENGLDILYCPLVSAPFGLDFTGIPFFWISLETTRILSILTNHIFSLNILGIVALISAAFICYKFCYFLTGNRIAALISGYIFGFSPYHLNKLMEFSYVYVGVFLVWYFYKLIKLKNSTTFKNALFLGISFGLLLAFSLYYALFSFVMTLLFLVFCLLFQWRDKLRCVLQGNLKTIKSRAVMGLRLCCFIVFAFIVGYLMNLPTTLLLTERLISKNSISSEECHKFMPDRPINYAISQSARPLSYLLPASTHPVFGEFTKKMFGSIFYGRGHIEHTLYLGWVPISLAFIGFREWKRKRTLKSGKTEYSQSSDNFIIGLSIFMALSAFAISMPPYLDLGILKIHYPSYYLHKYFPMVRAYARFGVIVSLFISILAGFGLKIVLSRLKNTKLSILIASLIFGAIFFEYLNIPPWRTTKITNVPDAYKWLSEQKGDFIIAEYPMSAASATEAQINYDYLYYQTFHHKRIVNGALFNTEAYKIREKILKIENPGVIEILKTLGVKYIFFHPNLYKTGSFKEAVDIIGKIPAIENIEGLKPIKQFDDVIVYEII